MENFKDINEILDFAIQSEQDAIDFYSYMQKNANSKDMKEIYSELIEEEMSHKKKLIDIKNQGSFMIENSKVNDLKISDYLVSVKAKSDLSYQEALVLVIQKEKAAFNLYKTLANRAPSELKEVFMMLANEEANHKLKFETYYDEYVLKEN